MDKRERGMEEERQEEKGRSGRKVGYGKRTKTGVDGREDNQWRNTLIRGPWTNYIKGPIPHFEFREKFIMIKVLKLPLNTKQ